MPSKGPEELATEHPSTKDPVYYRHIEYDPPLPNFEFVKPTGDIDRPPGAKPLPRVVEFVKPEPEAPPTAQNCPLPSGLVVKASCIIGGFVTTVAGMVAMLEVESATAAFATGGSLMGVGVIVIVAGICWPYR
ncbi:MAG TPA: hypothetical protein VHK03_15225 [Aestuariivirgaceae bacterium]|nr:hypothetical protein [Aestuariivirgaceae bacterium]